MKKLLLIFVILLSLQINAHATMHKFDLYDSISYNDLNVNSAAIIIDNPLYVSNVNNTDSDGYWGRELADLADMLGCRLKSMR